MYDISLSAGSDLRVNQHQYLQIFLDESREHLLGMQHWLEVLAEQPQNRQGLDALFRSVHSIKGMAASMGFRRLAAMAHAMEDGLDRLRRSGRLPAEAVTQLQQGVDDLEQRLADVVAGRPERDDTDQVVPSQECLQHLCIRMPEAAVSRWLLLINELMRLGTLQNCRPEPDTIAEGTLPEVLELDLLCSCTVEEIAQRCRQVSPGIDVQGICASGPAPDMPVHHGVGQATVRVSTRLLDRFVGLTGELLTARHRLQESLQKGQAQEIEDSALLLDRLLADLRHQVLDARMVPLEAVTATLPRLVRELCRKTGKDIQLKLDGTEVHLDRAILEALSDPLQHMVRNAVDHGIEDRGTITISAQRDRDRVTLDVRDDGRGLDRERLAARARDMGFCEAGQAAGMSDAALLQLICQPGFTTASRLTEISGRGIGMDVVRHTIDKLGGSLQLVSEPDQGVCFRFILPLTVSIVPVLLVEAGGQTVALPVMWIEQTLDIPARQLVAAGGDHVAELEDRRLPVYFLSNLLGRPTAGQGTGSSIVCELRGGEAGLVVDAVAGQQDVFVKPLSFPLNHIQGLSGATILGDGRIIFLLDPCALLLSYRSQATKGDML